jgi:hypothetical protein
MHQFESFANTNSGVPSSVGSMQSSGRSSRVHSQSDAELQSLATPDTANTPSSWTHKGRTSSHSVVSKRGYKSNRVKKSCIILCTPEMHYNRWLQKQQATIAADQAAYDPEHYRRIQRRREKRLIHAMRNGLPAREDDLSSITVGGNSSSYSGMTHHIARDVQDEHEYNLSLAMARDEDLKFAKQLERNDRKKVRLEAIQQQLRLRGVEASSLASMRLDERGVLQYEGKPPLANYGHANTSPLYGGFVYGNYMASHNGMKKLMKKMFLPYTATLYLLTTLFCLSQCIQRCLPTFLSSPTPRRTGMPGVSRCRVAYTPPSTCHFHPPTYHDA